MELRDLILEYKNQYHINNSEIARRLGVSKSTVHKWLTGDVKHLQKDTMEAISKVVGYDVKTRLEGKIITFKKPILGYVKGGYDLFADENYMGEEELTEKEYLQGDYFLQVTGDSMIGDGIMDGSLVYVKQTNTIDNGKIGVVLIDDEVTVKRIIKKDHMLILEASNPQVPSRYFSEKEVKEKPIQIIGQVLYVKTTL